MMRAVWATSASTAARPACSGGSARSKYSTRNCSPLSSRMSTAGSPRSMRHPTSERIVAFGRRSASASATLRRRYGVTSELPPPMASWLALGPITATLETPAGPSGSSPSLTSRTVPSAATSRATARRPGSSSSRSSPGARSVASSTPTRAISRNTWRIWPSTTVSSTSPSRDGGGQGRAEPGRGARHLEVEAGPHGGDRRVGAEPVRHHQPVEAPFVPQHPIEEVELLAAVDAIDLVVRGHHRPNAGLAHGGFEGDEVDLPECPLGDLGADGHPLVLLVVAGVVLDAAPDPGSLHPPHVGDGQARRQQRVLGEGLEGASGQRRTRDADRRSEQHVDALGVCLGGQHVAEALHQRRVPGRRRPPCRRAATASGDRSGSRRARPRVRRTP